MSAQGSRDLVFTTLIDLLVQIIFIFTIVIVVIPGAEHASAQAVTHEDPDPFRRLSDAVFGEKGSGKRSVGEVSKKAEDTRLALVREQEEVKRLKDELKAKSTKKGKEQGEGSAPGLERCVVATRRGRPLLQIRYLGRSRFELAAAADAQSEYEVAQVPPTLFVAASADWAALRAKLEPIAAAGRLKQCTYVLDWQHVAGLEADDVLDARGRVEQLFYLTRPVARPPTR